MNTTCTKVKTETIDDTVDVFKKPFHLLRVNHRVTEEPQYLVELRSLEFDIGKDDVIDLDTHAVSLVMLAGVYPSLCQLHDKEVLTDTGVIVVHKVTAILL